MSEINFEQSNLTPRPYVPRHFDNHHTAPLLVLGPEVKPRLVRQQDRLLRHFGELALYEIDRYSTKSVAQYAAERIRDRIHQVEGMNASIYNFQRLNKMPDLTVEWPDVSPRDISRACKRAKIGKGTASQNELAREAYGMPSTGLAELTIIGEQRLHLEPAMWDDVGELVEADVTPQFEQMTNLRVLGLHVYDPKSNNPENFGAIRIGMKRDLHELSNGSAVKNRTIALINTDPRYGLERDDFEEILDDAITIDKTKNRFELVPNFDMSRNAAFMRVVKWLIEEKQKPGTVLARNESVYSFNSATQLLVNARREEMLKSSD